LNSSIERLFKADILQNALFKEQKKTFALKITKRFYYIAILSR